MKARRGCTGGSPPWRWGRGEPAAADAAAAAAVHGRGSPCCFPASLPSSATASKQQTQPCLPACLRLSARITPPTSTVLLPPPPPPPPLQTQPCAVLCHVRSRQAAVWRQQRGPPPAGHRGSRCGFVAAVVQRWGCLPRIASTLHPRWTAACLPACPPASLPPLPPFVPPRPPCRRYRHHCERRLHEPLGRHQAAHAGGWVDGERLRYGTGSCVEECDCP